MTEFTRDPLAPRAKPSKDTVFYAEWGRQHTFCAACGRDGPTFGLQSHHIVKQGRSHEAANLLRLCAWPCHSLAEGLDVRGASTMFEDPWLGLIRVPGDLLPKITLGIALSMKLRCDPAEVDMARLQELRGSRLPDPEEIPLYFVRQFAANRPDVIPGVHYERDA